jgi:hypothetical protein
VVTGSERGTAVNKRAIILSALVLTDLSFTLLVLKPANNIEIRGEPR